MRSLALNALNPRVWLALFLIVVLCVLLAQSTGNQWVNSGAWAGIGPVKYPNADCGHNWFWIIKLPGGQCPTRGGVSDEFLSRELVEQGAADVSPDEAITIFREILYSLEAVWGTGF